MDSKRAAMAVILLLGVLVCLWALVSFVFPSAGVNNSATNGLTIYHTAREGMHRYRGSVHLPSACDTMSAAVTMSYQKPPKAHITLATSKPDTGVCPQTAQDGQFDVAVSSEEVPEVDLSLNGQQLQVALVEQ